MEVPELTAEQRILLAVAYEGFREAGTGPRTAWVDTKLDHDHQLNLDDVADGMPPGLVHRDPGYGPSATVRLTVAGLSQIDDARLDCDDFIRLVAWLAARERAHDPGPPVDPKRLVLDTDEIDAGAWGGDPPPEDRRNRVLIMVQQEGIATVGRTVEQADGGEPRERVAIEVDRVVRPYREVRDVADYITRRPPAGRPPGQLRMTSVPSFNISDSVPNYNISDISEINSSFIRPLSSTTIGTTESAEADVTGLYVFILMPFAASWSQNIKDLIDQACRQLREEYEDLSWDRADDLTDTGRITDQIISAIERADLIIADATGSNPNVMYELGYADALRRPIVVLKQEAGETPFDIHDWRQIRYSPDDLGNVRDQLVRHLDANLKRVREGSRRP